MRASRVVAWLSSAKLAAWLIGTYILMNVISFIVPQRSYLGTSFGRFVEDYPVWSRVAVALGLDHIFAGWPMAVVTSLLALNVTVCTVRRILDRRLPRRPSAPRSARSAALSGEWRCVGAYLDEAQSLLIAKRRHI
ncbi:MAG: hypothetical protein C0418_05905, partial [Coriobacteriaceae bacterium]|nr:hypothetical protein [Coriobacteriaceae bacterium]